MRVFAERLKVVSSSKVTPSEELAPVSSASFLKIGSLNSQRDSRGGIGTAHRRAALQGGDLTDLIGGGRV